MSITTSPGAERRPADHGRPGGDAPLQPLIDTFSEDVPPGRVIGTRTASGHVRRGADREGALSIDNGALRIRYLRDPGWGHAGLSYGPFPSVPGSVLAITIDNGLATSRTHDLPERWHERLRRMVRTFPDLRRPEISENLAIGLFHEAMPQHPPTAGPCFVVHSHLDAVGELWVAGDRHPARTVHSLQNVPITYVVVLRDGDAALYASSLDGAHGFTGYPHMRPLGIVPAPTPTRGQWFAGIHQPVLGEVRYEVDTRLHRVALERCDELSAWYSSAHVADLLTGAGPVRAAEVGGRWSVSGDLRRVDVGTEGLGDAGVTPERPTGLLRAIVEAGDSAGGVALRWRGDTHGTWSVRLGQWGAELSVDRDGRREIIARDEVGRLGSGRRHTVQVLDDGKYVSAYLDGGLLFGRWFADTRGVEGCGVGFAIEGPDVAVRRFEAHPRSVPIPSVVDPGPPWEAEGRRAVFANGFASPAGPSADIAGAAWRRVHGRGTIEHAGPGRARIRADREHPNPGRTIYVVPWDGGPVDVAVTVTPPGTQRGQGHRGRAGLALWQDDDNHFVLNHFIDDTSVGVSVSAFLRTRGREEIGQHDATWSNVGGRIDFGVPFRLRLVSDGIRFTCFVDGEPVLHRRFSDYWDDVPPLQIRGVGIAANWEWGDDTGTAFEDFVARGDVRRRSLYAGEES